MIESTNSKQYLIYKITNTVNGKIYIGRTTQTIYKRWFVHKCHAKYDYRRNNKIKDKSYLGKAIVKYGDMNFTIKLLDIARSFEHMVFLEQFYISYFHAIDPKYGYNLILNSYGCNSDSPMNMITKNKIALNSKINAGKPEGVGLDKIRNKWVLRFKYLDKISVNRRYNDRVECENDRDILFYFYTKNDNPLNFYHPDRIEYYKEHINIDELLKKVLPEEPKNNFKGVYRDKANKFTVRLIESGLDTYLGMYNTEEEAVLVYDKVASFRGLKHLNLPHLKTSSYEIEGRKIFEKYTDNYRKRIRDGKHTSQYKGVSKRSTYTWEMTLTSNKERIREVHKTELSAALSYDAHIRRLNLNTQRLNFSIENE